MARTATLDELLTKKSPATVRVEIILDGELAERWHAAKDALAEAKRSFAVIASDENERALGDAQERVDDLKAKVEAATVEMRLRSIGRKAYEELLDAHPPTKEQRSRARKRKEAEPVFNDESFVPELIAASLVEPQLTIDEVEKLLDSDAFNAYEQQMFILAAMEVNQSSKIVSLGKDSAETDD